MSGRQPAGRRQARPTAERAAIPELTAARLHEIYDAMPAGIASLDPAGRIVDANPAACEILGLSLDGLRGRTLAECHRGAVRPDGAALPIAERPIPMTVQTRQPRRSLVIGITRMDEQRRWLRVDTVPVLGDDGEIVHIVCSFIDITKLKEAEQRLSHQALHDALTELPNRTLLGDRLTQAVYSAQRREHPLALLLMDLDRFKEVNDTLGHHHGDLLLQVVGARLRDVVRLSDTVARLGGDEFAILLPSADGPSAEWVARKVLATLAEPFDLEGHRLEVGASIGIALYPVHGGDAATLLRLADVAMYVAKRSGGGLAVYDAALDGHSPARLALEGELRQAIADDRLMLYFQPQIDIRSGRVRGVEALTRWQHPERGLLHPETFIPLSEQTGLIAPLNRWVLDTALHQSRIWRRAGLDLDVSINLSMHALHDPQLPDTLSWLLRRYGVTPSAVTLEITESVLMSELSGSTEVLARLTRLGVRLAIDDFGTGYSSLSYLKSLPVDELKIDKSFVTNLLSDTSDASILSFTIGLGHSLGLRVVAEGVEREETLELLAALGCDAAQGFYLSRPLPAADLEEWLGASPWGLKALGA